MSGSLPRAMWHQYRSHRSALRLCECLEVKFYSSTPQLAGLVNHIFSVFLSVREVW